MSHIQNIPHVARLITERLILRRCLADDAPWLADLAGDAAVMHYVTGGAMTPEKARAWARSRIAEDRGCTLGLWTIEEQRDRAFVGVVGLQPVADNAEVELVCRLRSDCWGRGWATEAARRMVAHGFVDIGLQSIVTQIHPENAAAHRVAGKLGFRFIGPWPSKNCPDGQKYRLTFDGWRDQV